MSTMNKKNIIIIVVAAVVALAIFIGVLFVGQYNSFATAQQEIESKEAAIDADLQRRADLIPNLVSTVKGLAEHEESVFDNVLEARQNLMGAETMEEKATANDELTTAINVIVEAYPELKSNDAYVSLMDQLEGTENRIAVARKDYNAAVEKYNKKTVTFPGKLFAGMFGFEEAEYFKAAEGAQDVPQVNFGD